MKQYSIEELNSLQKEEVVALMVQLQKQNDILTEQLAVMQASRFGRSTERLDCLGQTNFSMKLRIYATKPSRNLK